MLTIHALAAGDTLLIGTLAINRRRNNHLEPYLSVTAWCPERRDWVYQPWPAPPFPLEGVVEIQSNNVALNSTGRRFVGLDQTRLAEARRVLDDFRAKHRRWKSEAAFREGRNLDRAHLRAGWDVVPEPWDRGASLLPVAPGPDYRELAGGLGKAEPAGVRR